MLTIIVEAPSYACTIIAYLVMVTDYNDSVATDQVAVNAIGVGVAVATKSILVFHHALPFAFTHLTYCTDTLKVVVHLHQSLVLIAEVRLFRSCEFNGVSGYLHNS